MTAAGIGTRCVHAGHDPGALEPLVHPLVQSTATRWGSYDEPPRYSYAREGNPTVEALERRLTDLEGGGRTWCFASGLAAIDAVVKLVPDGGRIVVGQHVYGGTTRLLNQVHTDRFELVTVDASDNDAVSLALQQPADLVLVETPTNPTLRITDLHHVIARGHDAGALVAVDNTFLTPLGQQPLALGADISIHSTTKYLDGHNTTLGGSVTFAEKHCAERGPAQRLKWLRTATGAPLAPFEAWLTLQGSKTLHLRTERQFASAARLAESLVDHPAVERVLYPGLPGHPGHAAHRRQATADGGIVSIDVGSLEAAGRFVQGLRVFTLAENLGATESLASSPALMTHAALPRKRREADGITDGLVRLSVGVEDADDLIADVQQALAGLVQVTA